MSTNSDGDSSQALALALGQQLNKETLNDYQLQQLMAMQHNMQTEMSAGSSDETLPVNRIVMTRPSFRLVLPAITALLLIVVVSLLLQPTTISSQAATQDSVREIAAEVVKNHLKQKPLEVKTSSMVEVQGFFNKLDFLPQSSTILAKRFLIEDGAMLGGRYCSIKGVTAAQLRYKDASAKINTLYEVGYNPLLFGVLPDVAAGEIPREIVIKGLRVSLWHEQGILMVLVYDKVQ